MVQYKSLLRALFQAELLEYRKSHGCTQENMAERLCISTRSYIDLEHGKYSVSAIPMLFFLACLPDAKMVEVVRTFVLRAKEADENVRIA